MHCNHLVGFIGFSLDGCTPPGVDKRIDGNLLSQRCSALCVWAFSPPCHLHCLSCLVDPSSFTSPPPGPPMHPPHPPVSCVPLKSKHNPEWVKNEPSTAQKYYVEAMKQGMGESLLGLIGGAQSTEQEGALKVGGGRGVGRGLGGAAGGSGA